jgi:hypothetical protein
MRQRETLRRTGAVLLMLLGLLGAITSAGEAASGKEVALHLCVIALDVGIGLSGWLIWHGDGWRRVGALLLVSAGVFALGMGLGEVLSGASSPASAVVLATRFGVPALVCGWMLWRGRLPRRIAAVAILSWAASFTLQALVYSHELITAVVLITRSGIPGLVCGWLLWRGCELRQIGAVLLISWPTSYMIYALHRDNLESAMGELIIGLPSVAVGWLLWRQPKPRF